MRAAPAVRRRAVARPPRPDLATREQRKGGRAFKPSALGAFLGLCLAVLACGASAATPAGTLISNTAQVDYTVGSTAVQVQSNPVSVTVQDASTPASVTILQYAAGGSAPAASIGPTQCWNGSAFTPLPAPVLPGGTTLNTSQTTPLNTAATVHGGAPLFIRLLNMDQNRDPAVRDSVQVRITSANGDSEQVQLTETGVNSGEFVGYIPTVAAAAVPGDCILELARNETVTVSYVDPANTGNTAQASALVDPYGSVFDSRTGKPVNGARVRLVNAQTGQDAVILGDDGISRYPATVVTGSPATDSGGTTYTLPPGVFRFPLVAPGSYQLIVTPPSGYVFPSGVHSAALQQLPGAPFRISDGSYGKAFVATSPPAVAAIDVPVDATGTRLFLQKSTTVTTAAIGDFVGYTLSLQNASASGPFRGVVVTDLLPRGMKLRSGSVRINNVHAPDPQISPDGHQLTFTTGAIDAGVQLQIQYVTEVVAGAQGTQLTNSASARSLEGVASNPAAATILLTNDFFSDAGIIMGRLVQASCDRNTDAVPGIAGIRVYLEDGRYELTDKEGKYHFEGVLPGSHVVQVDTTTVPPELEVLECDREVRHAGRAWSQFVDLRGGTLWRADFRLALRPPPTGSAELELHTSPDGAQGLVHSLSLHAGAVPLKGLRLRVVLPEGLRYLEDSAQLNGTPTAAPAMDYGVLSFLVGAVPANSTVHLTLRSVMTPGPLGPLSIKAFGTFATPAQLQVNTATVSNLAQRGAARSESSDYRFSPHFDVLQAALKAADRSRLDAIAAQWRGVRDITITAVGHTDDTPIAAASRGRYADNYALSAARAAAVADYLRSLLGVDAAHVHTAGKGADEPLQGGHDPASLAANRRVDITITGERLLAAESVTLTDASERSAAVTTVGSWRRDGAGGSPESGSPASGALLDIPGAAPSDREPKIDIETLSSSAAWIEPATDFQASIPSLKIAIAHAPDQTVELSVNGQKVSGLDFDGVTKNLAGTVGLSRWRGVDLRDGENQLTAIVHGADGHEAARLERSVHYGDGAVHAELLHEQSLLSADGTTRPVIALRLFDRFGKPARNGTLAGFSVDAPYRSWFEVQSLHDNELVSVGHRNPQFEVGRDGIGRIELEPTAQAGTVVVHLRYSERHQEDIHVWLEPQARDWVLVGIASGTAAHSAISRNLQSAATAGLSEGYGQDGRVAFFAKGAIKGSYLLTAAYDSDRDTDPNQKRLLSTIEPNRYYAIYGDATEQRFEASSSDKLYLKVERGRFYALYGDFPTGLTVTDLSRYSRTFTGLKTEYAGERYGFTGFATRSDQNFAHDELAGDGTSGLYHLSHDNILINSDQVRIEVRDRFHLDQVLSTQTLSRYLDYSIDYIGGTLFFRQPVAGRDSNFNPQVIVADYETLGASKTISAGGRASVKSHDGRLEAGATVIDQGADAGRTVLTGTDLKWNATESTRLKAEFAHTDSKDPANAPQANAYLVDVQHVTDRLDTHVYYREQQPGFGLDQQLSIDAGQRRYGADARLKFARYWSVQSEVTRQDVLATGADQNLASAELRRQDATHTFDVGLRHVVDHPTAATDNITDQAYLGGSVDLLQSRVRLHASQDFGLAGHEASADYPNRTLLGADYRWTRDTTFFADYEHSSGAAIQTDTTRLGVRSTPWEHAQLSSSLGQQFTEYGPRLFSTLGLTQGWQLSEHLTLDFGLDSTSTVRGSSLQPVNPGVPLASGSLGDDYVAAFIGAMYRTPLWTSTSRLEHRNASSEERWVATSGFYREPLLGHAFSLAANLLESTAKTSTGTNSHTETVIMSWAFRPVSSRWIVLDRLDLSFARSSLAGGAGATVLPIVAPAAGAGTTAATTILTDTGQEAARVVDNFNSNWQLDPHAQLGLQLAARYSSATINTDRYAGFASLTGFDYRHDLTRHLDFGVHGTTLQSWSSHVGDTALGLDVGVTPARNVWISVGYNFRGYADRDFQDNRYTAAGPFITFRIKADQDTFKDLSLASLRPGYQEKTRP